MSIETTEEMWAREIAAEQHAFAEVRRLAAELAAAAHPVSHIGDGNGGWVRQVIDEALIAGGVYSPDEERRRDPAVYRKRPIPGPLRQAVFERDAYRCRVCGTWLDLTVDHIIPESKGGPATLDNLQTLCRSHNSTKGTRTP